MPRLCLLLFCLLASFTGVAQGIDSLLQRLHAHPQPDTLRLNLLNDIAYAAQFSDPALGLSMADTAVALAQRLQLPLKEAAAWSNKGVNYQAQDADSLAEIQYRKALALHTQYHNLSGVAKLRYNMGLLAFNRADYRQALEHYTQALTSFRTLRDTARTARVLNSMGVTYMYLSDYPQALQAYLQALHLHEATGNQPELANTFTNIGILYKNLGDLPRALNYHQQALHIHQQAQNTPAIAASLSNIATVYDEQGDTSKALPYYREALAIQQSLGNKRRTAGELTNIGIVYRSQRLYTTALPYLQAAEQLYQQLDDKNSQAIVLNEIGNVYVQLPGHTRQHYAQALHYQQQSLALAQAVAAPDREKEAWESLHQLYAAQHRYAEALDAYKHYIALRDTIYSEQRAKDITGQQIHFEYEKKEALLKANQEKQQALALAAANRQRIIRNAIAGLLALIVITGLIIFRQYKRRRDAEAEKKQAEFRARSIDTEMKVLRLQMNPHFIFNSLNSIGDYIARNDIATADTYLVRFAKVIRLILEHSEQQTVSLAEDLEALELYLQLEQLRLNNRFHYDFQVDAGIDPALTLVPPFLLQPLVENSIWHGMAGKTGGGLISIYIKAENERLICTVEDNGAGRTPATATTTVTAKRSWGMRITQARIDTVWASQPPSPLLQITDLQPGTRVQLILPLTLSF